MYKSIKFVMFIVIFSSIFGCQTITNIENTYEMEPKSSWPDQHRNAALKSYIYAQMSNNTYGQAGDDYDSDGNNFVLPSNYLAEHFANNGIGLAYSIFRKFEEDKLMEVVIAFRGTEGFFDFDDFWYGNAGGKQNPQALKLYKQTRSILDRDGDTNVPIILTGHSLGGALAIHAAINANEDKPVPYYVFNSSPRFKKLNDNEGGSNNKELLKIRHSLVETGEFLYSVRFPATEATQTYTPYNCNERFKPFTSHGIEKLAKCLTMIASLNDQDAFVKIVKKTTALNSE